MNMYYMYVCIYIYIYIYMCVCVCVLHIPFLIFSNFIYIIFPLPIFFLFYGQIGKNIMI